MKAEEKILVSIKIAEWLSYSDWSSEEDVEKSMLDRGAFTTLSGFIVSEDASKIALATQINDRGNCSGYRIINKGCILKRSDDPGAIKGKKLDGETSPEKHQTGGFIKPEDCE